MKQTLIYIQPTQHKWMKKRAREEKISMSAYFRKLIEKEMQRRRERYGEA